MPRTAALRPIPAAIAVFLAGFAVPASPATFFNFESPQTHPVALSPDGTLLFVVNTPDNRLSVFSSATLARVAEVPVGLEPVSVAPRPGAPEVWVVNHLSDTVDVVGTTFWNVARTIPVGDEPAAVAFTPDGSKAYVTISQLNEVIEIDALTKTITDFSTWLPSSPATERGETDLPSATRIPRERSSSILPSATTTSS
jgi:YVTN family beta-propeller protein